MLCARRTSISSRVMTATEAGVEMIGESVLVAPEARVATKPFVPAWTRSAVDTTAGLAYDSAAGFAACCERRAACPLRDAARRCGAARCAAGFGASTLTDGNSDDGLVCAFAGEPALRSVPSASTLAEAQNRLDREREMPR